MKSNRYDVVVVGAGPIGSYLSSRLAGLGYEVAVLERCADVGHGVCCTGIVGRECFDRFDLPRETAVFEGRTCKVHSPSGGMMSLARDDVQAYVVDRPALDRELASRAQRQGVVYHLSTKVSGLHANNTGVDIGVQRDGQEEWMGARLAVVSNGFGFALTRRSGLGQVGDYVLGAQAEVRGRGVHEVEVYLGKDVAPGFFAWLVPKADGAVLVGVLTRRTPGVYMKKLLARLEDQGLVEADQPRIAYGGIPLKPLPRTYADRMVVVGDAAGHVKPTTGGGIYYGLLGADIALETIDGAMKDGDLSARRLKRYEKGWREALGRELETGYWVRRLYERVSDQRIDEVFEIVERNGVHKALLQADDFSFDWHGRSIAKALRHKELRSAVWSAARSLLIP